MSHLRKVVDENRHKSNMIHKASKSTVAIVGETKKDRYRSAVSKRRETASSVSCGKPEARRLHISCLERVSKYCNC